MNFNIKLFFIMLIILTSGAILSQEEDERGFNNYKETDEVNTVITDELFTDYADKYHDLYKHKHEPHNKHQHHKIKAKKLFKRKYKILI